MRAGRRGPPPLARRWTMAAWLVLLAQAAAAQPPAPAARPGEILVERTVAIVGGAVVTASDVETAVALGLVEPGGPDAPADATAAVIDRRLMLHEVARFAPAEPDSETVLARVATLRARAGGEEALAAALARGGFTTGWLTAWVRDDLRIAAYLDQRFASTGVPAESEVTAYADAHRAEFERDGVLPADTARVARARLVEERRHDLISDWLADLRRRTEVIEFRRRPPA